MAYSKATDPYSVKQSRSVLPNAAILFDKLPRALRRHRLMKAWMRLTGEHPLQLVRIRDESFAYADRRSLERRRVQAVYFEYFEKYLVRMSSPRELLELLDSMGYQTCFCRSADYGSLGGVSHTIRAGLRGSSIPLLPVTGHKLPDMTDLLAVPKENLVRITA